METKKFKQHDFFQVCKNCKINCCKGARPPITSSRRMMIERYLRAQGMTIEGVFEKSTYTFPKQGEDGYCTFFDKDTGKCRIHPVKPETCVAGPITFDINLKTGRIEWWLKHEKICSLAGVLYENKEALLNHAKSAKRELLTLVRDLDSKELSTILKIEEPETFKIGEDQLYPEVLAKLKPLLPLTER